MHDMQREMQRDWEQRAEEDAINAVMGKTIGWEQFWASGERLCADLVDPHLPSLTTNPSEQTVLEIGCGLGRLLRPLSQRFRRAIGTDISTTMVEKGRELHPGSEYPGIEFVATDGASLGDIDDASVDLVVCFRVFFPVPSKQVIASYLRESLRVLKPGGGFLIEMPSLRGWYKVRGLPVVPRLVRPYLPPFVRQLYLRTAVAKDDRRRRTWSAGLGFSDRGLRRLFGDAGLAVSGLHPHTTNPKSMTRVVAGHRPEDA